MPNTVVFAFVKALAAELSEGQVELPSVPDVVIRLQKTLSDDNVQQRHRGARDRLRADARRASS